MNKLQKFILKLVYLIGVVHGLFTFTFNSTTQQFQLSKKLIYYNKLMTILSFIMFGLAIIYFLPNPLSETNLVIRLSQPLSLITVLVVVCDSYLVMCIKKREILRFLNSALKLQRDVGLRNFNYITVLFFATFLNDTISITVNILSIFVIPKIFPKYILSRLLLINIFQFLKVVSKFSTNVLVFALVFNAYLLKYLEMKIFRSIESFRLFDLKNPRALAQHGCQLSEKIDRFIIDYGKIVNLCKSILLLFSKHLVLLMIHSLADILIHVRYFYLI